MNIWQGLSQPNSEFWSKEYSFEDIMFAKKGQTVIPSSTYIIGKIVASA